MIATLSLWWGMGRMLSHTDEGPSSRGLYRLTKTGTDKSLFEGEIPELTVAAVDMRDVQETKDQPNIDNTYWSFETCYGTVKFDTANGIFCQSARTRIGIYGKGTVNAGPILLRACYRQTMQWICETIWISEITIWIWLLWPVDSIRASWWRDTTVWSDFTTH